MIGGDLIDKMDETGWDRLKAMFTLNEEDNTLAEEIQHIPNVVWASSMFGFLFGGRFGSRIGADFYKRHNKLTIYRSQMDAQRKLHSAKVLGFVKYGCRWGWRMGLFAGLYSLLVAGSGVYRDKNDALNYIAAGASTGAVYKIFGGWRSMVVATVLCAGISTPIGLLAQAGNALFPEVRKKEREEKEIKQSLWKEQLQVTEGIIKNMEKELNEPQQ